MLRFTVATLCCAIFAFAMSASLDKLDEEGTVIFNEITGEVEINLDLDEEQEPDTPDNRIFG